MFQAFYHSIELFIFQLKFTFKLFLYHMHNNYIEAFVGIKNITFQAPNKFKVYKE